MLGTAIGKKPYNSLSLHPLLGLGVDFLIHVKNVLKYTYGFMMKYIFFTQIWFKISCCVLGIFNL